MTIRAATTIFFMMTSVLYFSGGAAAMVQLNKCSVERLFANGHRLSRLFSQKKAPRLCWRGAFGGARRGQAAGLLGQPSLQWDTGRILKCAVHIGHWLL